MILGTNLPHPQPGAEEMMDAVATFLITARACAEHGSV
jgi:hypothetical protein